MSDENGIPRRASNESSNQSKTPSRDDTELTENDKQLQAIIDNLKAEHSQTEKALRESEQRLLQAVKVARLGIFEHDLNTGIFHCSPIMRELYGWAPEKLVTLESVMESIVPEDREILASAVRRTHDPKGPGLFYTELRILHPDGLRWIFSRTETFFEGDGNARYPVRTVGASVDITERKQVELELLASRQQLRTALDAAKLGVWNYSLATGEHTCDALACKIFGWPEDQAVTAETLLERVHPEDREMFLEQRDKSISGTLKPGAGVEYRIQLPDGSIRWLSVHRSVILDRSGKPVRLTGVVQDITDRKTDDQERMTLEHEFLHAQKIEAVGRLAGGIAHDFNNLLMVIRSYTEILQDSLPPHDSLRKNTQAIMKAADRAASLTGQMLAFSRKQVLSPIALNLNAAIDESARMLQRLIGEDIELHVIPAESAWTVRADPNQIAQVLMNLSVNARDAMPEGGSLTITSRNVTVDEGFVANHPYMLPGDYAAFSVADTGTGISKATQERMFEPFFTTKSVGKGTGLGLSTVYGIVKQSGGYIIVDSEPGRGACFTIYLPRVTEMAAEHDTVKGDSVPRGTETLLVVEDEDALRESICEFLESIGYTVLSANSGHQALTMTCQFDHPIHLMITDVVMPKMSGRELSQMLVTLRPELKTIFMSGYTDDEVVRHGVRNAEVAFLQKPFSLATLARKIREMLEAPKRPR
jgi:PAS domain S-box-containing protein